MTSNTNISSDKSEVQLYELLLYKKKDIIAIQEKLSMNPDRRKGPIENRNQTALNQSKKGKTLEDSFGLLFNLVEELRPIQEELDISGHLIPTILCQNIQDLVKATFGKMSLGEIYHLLLYLKEDINLIQGELGIVSYTNQEISGLEANKNAIVYLYMFRCSLKKWSRCVNINRG